MLQIHVRVHTRKRKYVLLHMFNVIKNETGTKINSFQVEDCEINLASQTLYYKVKPGKKCFNF